MSDWFTCSRAIRERAALTTLAAALVWLGALPAKAELPDAATLLADLGLNSEEIAKVQAGKLVRYAVQPASERELVAGLAFQVPISPRELVNDRRRTYSTWSTRT